MHGPPSHVWLTTPVRFLERQKPHVRIAVSGTHRVGKTTLAQTLGESLPGYDLVDEPYHDMLADGHVFAHPPTADDFEDQLEHSLSVLSDHAPGLILDRCPIDLLAYLLVAETHAKSVLEHWTDRIRPGMRSLDLVVFVPAESPDRIEVSEEDDGVASRLAVDREIRGLLLGDALDLGVEVVEVCGSPGERASQVLRRMGEGAGHRGR